MYPFPGGYVVSKPKGEETPGALGCDVAGTALTLGALHSMSHEALEDGETPTMLERKHGCFQK